MRIIHVVPSMEERHGGPSKSVHELSAALARAGQDVALLATGLGTAAETREGRLDIEIFPREWPLRLCASSGLRARLDRPEADVVQHHSLWLRTLHYAHRGAVRGRAALVVSPRGMMSDWAWSHHNWRKRLAGSVVHPGALAAVDGWHVTSEQEIADVRSRGFSGPICVAPNGVNAPTAESLTAAAQHWHEACPETLRRPVALFYSRFHRKKRVLELIDLWLQHGPRDWLLLVAGIPEDYAVEELEDYVLRSLGGGRVRVFDGLDQPPPYAVSALFLLPSHSENFGLSIAEALAHGVPALVTDTTPWAPLNANGGGWCVPWRDYAAALQAAVAESPADLRARGARARAWVLAEYGWDKSAGILGEFYEKLRTTRKSPA
jgi:glycosyltransferase involved in cell wall biosynthesis